ncbi:MAG: Flp pilus assembly protein CpaB [Actinobacteria bacterium]|nr:Flp pilus assembly protein CpaB [Actinomycetota bacterium]
MSSRRTLILLAALAVGLVAAVLLYVYISGIENRAIEGARRVPVFYATADIKRGTPGEDAVKNTDIQQGQIPQNFKPATAITNTDEVNKKVALFDIPANTVILQNMFVDPSTTSISFRQRLKRPDQVAISIQSDQMRAVGGFLVGGDEVNMFTMVTTKATTDTGGTGEGNQPANQPANQNTAQGTAQCAQKDGFGQCAFAFTKKARMLYQKVQILAVGQNAQLLPGESTASSASGESGSSQQTQQKSTSNNNIFTLNVPPEAAEWIASAQETNGALYLSLVAEDYKPFPVQPVPDIVVETPGEKADRLTPYGPEGNTEK